ncbi:unnamed protein product [Phaedon cochleariae]|uniref:CCHC-type domain-containing protein n=1 Tax=Phaedon cochleariae TaxID=80249 RepID=A0A9N9WZT4_PHACE|nr:unnamed protein product [Phaedon cochleariae]
MPHNSNNNNPGPGTSYVSAVKTTPKPSFPKKDQAIVMHADDNLKLFDYVKAIGDIASPKHISFASRISNNRICIYLDTSKLVDDLIKSHSFVTINNNAINIRRLVSPTKRIIISNISPYIPHDLVEDAIKSLGLQITSPVSFLRAGIPGDEYSHILSFRRQVYVLPTSDNFELQTSLTIPFDGNENRIFLSTDKMECFICKQSGHIASNCPNPPTNILLSQTNPPVQPEQASPSTNSSNRIESNDTTSNVDPITPQENPPLTDMTPSQKRGYSQLSTPSETSSLPVDTEEIKDAMPPPASSTLPTAVNKATKKKRKIGEATESNLTTYMKVCIAKSYQKTPDAFILPIENLYDFLENTFGSSDPFLEARKHTDGITGLVSNLNLIYTDLTDRSLKNRITRITNKMKKRLKSDTGDTESLDISNEPTDDEYSSDCSQQSHKSSY